MVFDTAVAMMPTPAVRDRTRKERTLALYSIKATEVFPGLNTIRSEIIPDTRNMRGTIDQNCDRVTGRSSKQRAYA